MPQSLNQPRALPTYDRAARREVLIGFFDHFEFGRERIAELGCPPAGENPKAFVDRGGLRHLEAEAAEVAIRRVREAAYPVIFELFGGEMPRGKERKLILTKLGQDLALIEKALGYRLRSTPDDAREGPDGKRGAAAKRRGK